MMDLYTIRSMAQEATQKAAKLNLLPLGVAAEDMEKISDYLRYMPNLGDHVPEGYELIQEHFVDSSGWGTQGGSAITQEEFFEKVQVGRYYAVVEAGQFQVHIGEYKKL